jgi:signal transduction histidine kinase
VILEFLGIVTFDDMDSIIFFWFIEKIILALVLVKVLLEYGKVKKAAVEMAAGNMDVSVNTEGMFIDFEEHGEALNEIASGLNNAISERMKSERMKTELITNVSHDIKTPLTSVINYVDLLQKEDFENETARGYLEVLDRQAKRLKKLIEDLIEASKAATGSIKFNIENVNARVLLNQSIGEFDDRLTDKNITVVTEVPEKDVYVKADNRYLFRVFDNLMSNIVKYSQEGTRAYVELKEKDGRAQYTFKNISREKLNISADELMERFVRGDLSRNTEGNGLGLSIARSLTESMGGKMELTVDGDLFRVDVSFPEETCA